MKFDTILAWVSKLCLKLWLFSSAWSSKMPGCGCLLDSLVARSVTRKFSSLAWLIADLRSARSFCREWDWDERFLKKLMLLRVFVGACSGTVGSVACLKAEGRLSVSGFTNYLRYGAPILFLVSSSSVCLKFSAAATASREWSAPGSSAIVQSPLSTMAFAGFVDSLCSPNSPKGFSLLYIWLMSDSLYQFGFASAGDATTGSSSTTSKLASSWAKEIEKRLLRSCSLPVFTVLSSGSCSLS